MSETYRRAQYAQSPQTQTINLTEFRAELRLNLREALGADPNTVSIIRPPPGSGKTWITAEEIAALPEDKKTVIFAQTQSLAMEEWEKRIPGSLRLMSLERMADEGALTELVGAQEEPIECPFLDEIADRQAKNLPYFDYLCASRCPFRGQCSYHRRKKDARDAKVLVCQHAHIPTISRMGLCEDRIVIVDECAAAHFRSRIEFTETNMASFRTLLTEFETAGEADGTMLESVRQVLKNIEAVPVGQSKTFSDSSMLFSRCEAFQAKFTNFLSQTGTIGSNLFHQIKYVVATQRFVRCSERNGTKYWWSIRSNLPSNRQPIVILDATGSRELYQAIFPGRDIRVWPEDNRFAPKSHVTVFADGAYPQSSLFDTKSNPPKPTACFSDILDHIDKTISFHGTPTEQVGIVSLLKLEKSFLNRFPSIRPENILHCGALRGRNGIKQCPLIFIVGCQPPSLLDVAELAVLISDLDCEPSTLIGDPDAQRTFEPIDGLAGAFQSQRFAFQNPHMRIAWNALVTAEVAQAVGRARVHDDRDVVQHVYVFTSIDIGMPATRVMTRREHLKEMGFETNKVDRLCAAIRDLSAQKKPFGYKRIAELSGIELKALKAPKYQAAIKRTVAELDICVSGKPAKFEKEAAN